MHEGRTSIPERAAVLRGSEPPVSVPLSQSIQIASTAAERPDHAGGLMPELLQALDDIGRHAILELVDAFVGRPRGISIASLHVATVVEHVG